MNTQNVLAVPTTPGLLWVNAWPTRALNKDELQPSMVAIPVAAVTRLSKLLPLMNPAMAYAVFGEDYRCSGARLLCQKSVLDKMYADLEEPMDWPEGTIWVAPNGIEYAPYYPVGSIEYDFEAPAEVMVWNDGSFQLRWDAMDHADGDLVIESAFFTLEMLEENSNVETSKAS